MLVWTTIDNRKLFVASIPIEFVARLPDQYMPVDSLDYSQKTDVFQFRFIVNVVI